MVNPLIIHVLGTAQDGGYPHAGCKDECCLNIWDQPSLHRLPASIAAIDQKNKKFYLFEANNENEKSAKLFLASNIGVS